MYTDELLNFFKDWHPNPDFSLGMKLTQYVGDVKMLNSNRAGQDYENERALIDKMRAIKLRKCPLIVLNYDFSSGVFAIDSDYRRDVFMKAFRTTVRRQFFGEHIG